MQTVGNSKSRRASIVDFPDHASLLVLRAANGHVLREVIYPSASPESWKRAFRVLRREAASLGYVVDNQLGSPKRAVQRRDEEADDD
jgi:hypothetical protein